jgi:5-methylcytosine-specific restriction endonuclease McrA
MKGWSARKRRVHVAFGYQCVYCGKLTWHGPGWKAGHIVTQKAKRLATVDHIVPVVLGGTDALWNLVSSCRLCNSSRGHQDFVDYVYRVADGDAEKLRAITDRFCRGMRTLLTPAT